MNPGPEKTFGSDPDISWTMQKVFIFKYSLCQLSGMNISYYTIHMEIVIIIIIILYYYYNYTVLLL